MNKCLSLVCFLCVCEYLQTSDFGNWGINSNSVHHHQRFGFCVFDLWRKAKWVIWGGVGILMLRKIKKKWRGVLSCLKQPLFEVMFFQLLWFLYIDISLGKQKRVGGESGNPYVPTATRREIYTSVFTSRDQGNLNPRPKVLVAQKTYAALSWHTFTQHVFWFVWLYV